MPTSHCSLSPTLSGLNADCWLLLARNLSRRTGRAAIFLEFVMQRFKADAENLCGPRFIVAGCRQRFQDEHLLGLLHSGANFQPDTIGVAYGNAQSCAAKVGRQMPRLNQ